MSRTSALAERVRLRILQGELLPGELLIEPQLMTALGTTRGPLREALRYLEGRGLLTADHGGGMHVVRLDDADVAETLRVRAVLEELSAGLAAGRCRTGRLDPQDVRAVLARDPRGAEGDRSFHLALDLLADNRPGHDALVRLWDRLLLVRPEGGPVDQHRAIAEAIVLGDAEAAGALAREHVLAGV